MLSYVVQTDAKTAAAEQRKKWGEGAENKIGHSIFFPISCWFKRGGMVLLYLRNYGNVKCARYQNQNVADQVFDV